MYTIRKQFDQYFSFVIMMPDAQSYVSFRSVPQVHTAAFMLQACALLQF